MFMNQNKKIEKSTLNKHPRLGSKVKSRSRSTL